MPDLTVTHHVHELDGTELGTYLGGANDPAQAVAVACAVFTVMQQASLSADRIIAVVDDAGTTVAFVGRHPVQAG